MAFQKFELTNDGINLLAQVQAELGSLNFTKIKIGSGVYAGDIKLLTDVITEFHNFPVTSTQVQPDKSVKIQAPFDNSTFTQAYSWREIGIFAKLGETGPEILYSYSSDPTPDTIPDYDGGLNKYRRTLDIRNYISDVDSVTLEIVELTNKYDFNTVAEMVAAAYLVDGDRIQLWGYHALGDGGNHERIISSVNNGFGIPLGSLFANPIYEGNGINVKHFGAKGDNINNDRDAINNSFRYSEHLQKTISQFKTTIIPIYFPNGIYKIDSNIELGSRRHLIGDNSIIKSEYSGWLFGDETGYSIQGWQFIAKNIVFEAPKILKLNTREGFESTTNLDNGMVLFDNVGLLGTGLGIEADVQSSKFSFENSFSECHIRVLSDNMVIDKCRFNSYATKYRDINPEYTEQIYLEGTKNYIKNSFFVPYEGSVDPLINYSFISQHKEPDFGSQGNRTMLSIDGVSFGAESSGTYALKSWASYEKTAIQGSGFDIRNCSIGGTRPAVLMHDLPGLINFESNYGVFTEGLLIDISDDLETNLLTKLDNLFNDTQWLNTTMSWTIRNNGMKLWENVDGDVIRGSYFHPEIEQLYLYLSSMTVNPYGKCLLFDGTKHLDTIISSNYLLDDNGYFKIPALVFRNSAIQYNRNFTGLNYLVRFKLSIKTPDGLSGTYKEYSRSFRDFSFYVCMATVATNQSIRIVEDGAFHSNFPTSTIGEIDPSDSFVELNGVEQPIGLVPGDGYGAMGYIKLNIEQIEDLDVKRKTIVEIHDITFESIGIAGK